MAYQLVFSFGPRLVVNYVSRATGIRERMTFEGVARDVAVKACRRYGKVTRVREI